MTPYLLDTPFNMRLFKPENMPLVLCIVVVTKLRDE